MSLIHLRRLAVAATAISGLAFASPAFADTPFDVTVPVTCSLPGTGVTGSLHVTGTLATAGEGETLHVAAGAALTLNATPPTGANTSVSWRANSLDFTADGAATGTTTVAAGAGATSTTAGGTTTIAFPVTDGSAAANQVIVGGGDTVSLRLASFSVNVTTLVYDTVSSGVGTCTPTGPAITVATAAVRHTPRIIGFDEYRFDLAGGPLAITGVFDSPVRSVTVGDVAASFQQTGSGDVRVVVPPAPSTPTSLGLPVVVKITTDAGTTSRSIVYSDEGEPRVHLKSVALTCVGTTDARSTFPITARVRMYDNSVDAQGYSFRTTTSTEYVFGSEARTALGGAIGPGGTLRAAFDTEAFGLTGVTSSSFAAAPGGAAFVLNGADVRADGAPIAVAGYPWPAPLQASVVVPGNITSPTGGSIDVSYLQVVLRGTVTGGPSGPAALAYQCTPSDDASVVHIPILDGAQPVVTGISPAHGPASGGNTVTINGTFSNPIASVRFRWKRATIVSQTATQVVVQVPPGDAGTSDIVFVETAAHNGASLSPSYQYDDPSASVTQAFTVSGNATLKTLAKGAVALKGSLAGTFDPSGGFSGDLSLDQTAASLKVLGFLPVTAKLALVPTAPLTGTATDTALSATAKLRVKVPSMAVAGIPLSNSANCQASQISTVALASTGGFSKTTGGTLAGTFSISNLSGCGGLNGIVSSLTAGGGNALALTLKPTV